MKPIITKYCLPKQEKNTVESFEQKFENYIAKQVKKIIVSPEKYTFISIINEEQIHEEK